MGEFFELFSAGILDEMGEYIGEGPQFEFAYSTSSKRPKKTDPDYDPVRGIDNFIRMNHPGKVNRKVVCNVMLRYAHEVLGQLDRKMPKILDPMHTRYLNHVKAICRIAQNDWKQFVTWFDKTYGTPK